tara:strand:- start:2056 stop:2472 length:417 start_codon:yes stop_codon:yes gene_type:complete
MKLPIYILSALLIFSTCNKKDNYIQDVYVNINVDLNLPEYSNLQASGNSIFIEGGVEGIIIYHGIGSDYKVYDRNCSYEPSLTCSKIDSINATLAYCDCCPSVFLLDQDGIPVNAPALSALKAYNWNLGDNNILRISN